MRELARLILLSCAVAATGAACISPPETTGYTFSGSGPGAGSGTSSTTLNSAVPIQMLSRGNRDPNFSVGPDSKYNAVADFDGDGVPDVVVSNNVLNNLRLYFSPAMAPNTAPTVIEVADGPRHVAAVDLNHDSKIDLAVVTDANVVVLLNSGGGNFAAPVHYSLGATGGHGVAVADFNGDTYPDMVVSGPNSYIMVFFNNGDGTFAEGVKLPTNNTDRANVNAGDVSGDGKPDIVGVTSDSPGMYVYINTGNGAFAPAVTYSYPSDGLSIPLVDLNADGSLDAIVADNQHTITMLFNDGQGGFAKNTTYALNSNEWADSFAFGDLNLDGLIDLAVSTWEGSEILAWPNQGGGKFGAFQHFPTPDFNWQVQIADMDGDGRPDVVDCEETYTLTLFINETP